MIFQGDATYYEVLEIQPDASAQDIRNAYSRIKSHYRKDNLALYSLMDDSETDEMLQKIEEAFQILSDPELRRDYDERHGILAPIENKIVSIDRVPPMETSDDTDLLVPPATDFTARTGTFGGSEPRTAPASSPFATSAAAPQPTPAAAPPAASADRRVLPTRRSMDPISISGLSAAAMGLDAEIAQETEWKGAFIRKIRELRRFSLDDLATQTKISKTYLNAIEEENYEKLPAAVFVRGFITQIAKSLKLPTDRVAAAYMARYKR